ncbi:MAG: helix-turn-helix domain-containing protein, partial [Blastopirellula sp. JB062]
LSGNDEIEGMSDYDLFARSVADNFVEDDQRVMKSGRSLINRVEAWRDDRTVRTSKFPLRNRQGRVVGLMGTFQVCQHKQRAEVVDPDLQKLVDSMRANLHLRPSIEELARQVYMSERQLRRRFQKAYGVSIQQYQITMRIDAAKTLLGENQLSLVEIALRLGFCDQSALTRCFRSRVGITPQRYRRQLNQNSD